jgi:DMSO/TMAO reductase YedYZ molybdopterin-dependent catalytic subunit
MLRREFLKWSAAGAWLVARRLNADHHVDSEDPLVVDFDIQTLDGRYTSIEDFYVRNHFDASSGPGGGILQIQGAVHKPLKLAPEDLDRLRTETMGAVLECAGNGTGPRALASNGLWQGWRLADVVALAQPAPEGKFLHLYGQDGYARSVPLNAAVENGMLATRLNHSPLRPNHGRPWRALFPGWYGMDSVKWLVRIEVAGQPLPAVNDTYLTLRSNASGQIERAPLPRVQVKSVMIAPAAGAVLKLGTAEVRGVAWSGVAPVAKVEVSIDGGQAWQSTQLDPGARFEWALWRGSVNLSRRGMVELACRATDQRGNVQPASRDPNRLDGYVNNVIERVRCLVV